MRGMRRVALYVALPLVLACLAGFAWYRLSDTARGWRYEDKLAGYCKGVIPYDESAFFTDLDTAALDYTNPSFGAGLDYDICRVANFVLALGRIPGRALGASENGQSIFTEIQLREWDVPPTPLGGGWHGFTSAGVTSVVLPCRNKDVSVAVSAQEIAADDPSPDRARKIAELVTATAVNAARRWSCEADPGGRIPDLPATPKPSRSGAAEGTCQGVPLRGRGDLVRPIMETKTSGTAPVEGCLLGASEVPDGVRGEPRYRLYGSFGPFAQRLRSASDEEKDGQQYSRTAGSDSFGVWASAKCPGFSARALFTLDGTESIDTVVRRNLAEDLLTGFARASAERHHCTDLRLPG
ncbi:hypothetical protein GCM10010372_63500 [Streptomyces tauricus]|uniref:hypothetical protein n=1 Tax=Streptomyces tauricus TaxID=68274 RepID=UPI0016792879|nr:hypothetical protein [Streptomyces tauricus]MCW8097359.1 hypothetical protein [Streptomyces tauricus]GHA54771.1 hypothetical protein GCM10010372_63500 [Streptomyces tauricus]